MEKILKRIHQGKNPLNREYFWIDKITYKTLSGNLIRLHTLLKSVEIDITPFSGALQGPNRLLNHSLMRRVSK